MKRAATKLSVYVRGFLALLVLTLGVVSAYAVPGPVYALAQSVVIDDFTSGTVTASACGNSIYVYFQSPTIVGGARELEMRDGHSCVLGGHARMRVDATAGIAEWYGATAPEAAFMYGTEIGTRGAFSIDPNIGQGTPLNLSLTLGDNILVKMVQVQNPFIQIRLRDGNGATYQQNFSLAVGTNLFPLSSFPGLTPAAAADIDGISFLGSANSGNTAGSGDIVDQFAVAPPANVVYTSGAQVQTWDPIFPSSAYSDWPNQACVPTPAVGLSANWVNPHNAYDFGPNAHPWQPTAGFAADWINAWSNLSSQGPSGQSWTKYQTSVTGSGNFVLNLLADNCSWVYLDGTLVGFQNANLQPRTYPVTLSGTQTLTFIIFDGGGLAGGMYRLETNGGTVVFPVIAANNASVTTNQGTPATNTGTYSYANGGGNVPVTASVGTVTKTGTNSGTWSWSNPSNAAPFDYDVTIMAGSGPAAFTQFHVHVVTNAPPTVSAASASVSVNEGGTAANTGSYSDTDAGQNVSITASVGTVTKTGTNSGTWNWNNPAPDGPSNYNVTITANDGNGGVANTTFAITVTNVAPTTAITGAPASSPESTAITVGNTTTDPSSVDTAAGFTYAWSVTKNGSPYGTNGSGASYTFTPDDNGAYVATLTATDKDGGVGTDSKSITVTNVNPTANAGSDVIQFWGLPVALIGTGADVSPVDVAAGLIASWTFGDGPGTASGFSVTHTYAAPGGYTATLTVKDKDGGAGADTALATINKRGTTVAYTGATTSTFGFAATLSAKLTDVVDAGTALLGGRTITFTVNGNTITATTNASGVATATAPALLMPGTYPVAVGFASDSHYLASTAQGSLTVQNTVGGKVTGGVGGDDGCKDSDKSSSNKDDKSKGDKSACVSRGHGGFNVQATSSGVKGELEFESKTVDFHAHIMTALGISPDGKKAWFAGVGKDGTPFVVYVEDNGEPGRNDKFQLWIAGVPQNGDGSLTTGGNIQIHLKSSGDKDDKDKSSKS